MKSRLDKIPVIHARQRPNRASTRRLRTRGVALVITLILLALLGAASAAMVLLVSSDTLINGYYRNYRGSFYAADSGVNVVVEALKGSILTAGTQNTNPPLPATVPASVTSSYTPFQNSYYTFGDANSWHSQFMMVGNPGGAAVIGAPTSLQQANAADSASCMPATLVTCPNGQTNDQDYVWTFSYPYQVTIQGQSSGFEGEQITQTGAIVYTSISGSNAGGPPPSFSKWAAFITNFASCQGPLTPGTMTGPFFTDGQWNFGNFSNPGYTFTGSIQQVGANASWWNNSTCTNSATAPKGFSKPSFPSGGLQVNQNAIVPPSDTYNQAQAVLDGKGIPPCTATPCPADPAPSQTQMNQVLQTIGGTPPPASGSVPTGVYAPYYTGHGCANVHGCYGSFNTSTNTVGYGGGFYIQGNASIKLTATTASNGDLTETYAITQGSTTTTIVVDNTAGTTTLTSGSTTLALTGVPQQINPNNNSVVNQTDPSGAVVNPTLLYVNGQITGLTGPYDSHNNPQAAVQNDVGITIAASGAISITGDLEYAQLPVAVPSDSPNNSTNAGVLGVFTNGNINLYPDPGGNLTIDGSLAALSGNTTSGTSGFATPGGSISSYTIVGGRAEDQAHAVSISSGNTYYDTRFGNNFGPPWFPTAVPQPGTLAVPSSEAVSVNRATWAEVNRP